MKFTQIILATAIVASVSVQAATAKTCTKELDTPQSCKEGKTCNETTGACEVSPIAPTTSDYQLCNHYGVAIKTVKADDAEYEEVKKHADRDGKCYQKPDKTYVPAPVPITVCSQYGKKLNKVLDYVKDVAEYAKACTKVDVVTDTCYKKAADYDSKPDNIILCNKYGKKSGAVLKYDSEEHKKARDYCHADGRAYFDDKTKTYAEKGAPIVVVDENGVKTRDCLDGDKDYEKAGENQYNGTVYQNKETGACSGYGAPIAVCDASGKETGDYVKPGSDEYKKAIAGSNGGKAYKNPSGGYEAVVSKLTSGAIQLFGQFGSVIAVLAIVMF